MESVERPASILLADVDILLGQRLSSRGARAGARSSLARSAEDMQKRLVVALAADPAAHGVLEEDQTGNVLQSKAGNSEVRRTAREAFAGHMHLLKQRTRGGSRPCALCTNYALSNLSESAFEGIFCLRNS